MSLFWVRHAAAGVWCRAIAVHDSVVTACRGRFDASEDYAIDADPPASERCAGCERSRIVDAAAPGVAQDWDLGDLGGET